MDRIPPTLVLSLPVALDFFTTSANTKKYAPLNRDGDFLYQQQAEGPPIPLTFTSWEEAVQASKDQDVPYISVGGNGRVVERITTAFGGTDFGRVIPIPPAAYAEYAGQALDYRKQDDASPEVEERRAAQADKKRRNRAAKRHVVEELPT